jgi:nickel/cobalt transporter (NicO) family protein
MPTDGCIGRNSMVTLITGSLVLSVLHALIPNHWLPVLAISRKENWSIGQTTYVTFISGLSHALSTVLIGIVIGLLGITLAEYIEDFTHIIAPLILISLGCFYVYQHYRHKHFHLHGQPKPSSRNRIVIGLLIAMFFSPCFEIEAYFLMAGAHGWKHVTMLAILYTVVTVLGMVVWIRIAYKGLVKLNWHTLEHNAGIITGVTLIVTGIASFFIH